MAFGGFGRRKNGTTSFFVQAVLVILLIWLLFLGITLALTLRFSLNTMQEKTDNGLSSVAESLAASAEKSISGRSATEDMQKWRRNASVVP